MFFLLRSVEQFECLQNFPWIACDGCVADLYIDYLEDLVSAHPEYLLPVLHRVCSLLVSPGQLGHNESDPTSIA